MTKREFLDTVFALAPNEANAIMDAFDEYVDSNEPHWIPVTERLPEEEGRYLVCGQKGGIYHANYRGRWWTQVGCGGKLVPSVVAWCELPEPYKGVTE